MILEAFEKVLASKWGEFLIPNTDEEENKPVTHPVALAIMALEKDSDNVHNGEVTITPGLDKYWRVLEKEYSISRRAAEVLMIMARKYPSVVKVKALCKEQRQVNFREFEAGLDELADAGVLDKTEKGELIEYELSHDLLASVVFEENFAELWKETQKLRATRRILKAYKNTDDTDDNQPL